MKYLLKYNQINEKVNYNPEDVVLIRYWLTGDIIPVKIEKIYSKNSFLISYSIDSSIINNAPDEIIQYSEIIGKYKGIDDPAVPTKDSLFKMPLDDWKKTISNDMTYTNMYSL